MTQPIPAPPLPAAFADGPAAVTVARGVIRASGPDTEAFLQGQLSQDVVALAPGESRWSLLLQPQGKVDAWLRVTRIDAETYLLDLDDAALDATMARLSRFKLRTKCDLEPATWQTVAIRGAGSHAAEVPADSGAEVVVPAEWPGVEGIDLLGPQPVVSGIAEATPADLEALRILAGVPAMGAELTEDTIPAEAGVVERSVSFTKGCYTGQELVARIDSRGGNVPRNLRGIVALGPVDVGAEIMVDDAVVGTITSAVEGVGLGYVKRSVAEYPAAASVAGVDAVIHELPLI